MHACTYLQAMHACLYMIDPAYMIPPNVKNLRAVVGKSWMCLSLEGNSTSPLLAGE